MSGTKTRHEDIRRKIENACRSSAADIYAETEKKSDRTKGLKRLSADRDETHEWLKQKAYLERRQHKRQRAISVAKWSFEGRKQSDKPQPRFSKHVSLGASHLVRKNRTVGISCAAVVAEGSKNMCAKTSNAKGRSKPPTSFQGLLSILGQQAQADT